MHILALLTVSAGSAPSYSGRLARHDLEVHEFPVTGRGLRTTSARASGEPLLIVPDTDVILAERVLRSSKNLAAAAAHAMSSGAPLTEDALLACYIVEADNEYARMLPALQPTVVCIGSDAALLPRCYRLAISETRAFAVSQHGKCAAALQAVGAAELPLDAFLRAWAHVRARSVQFSDSQDFGIEPRSELLGPSRGRRKALLPYYDMVNHRSGASTSLL